MLVNKTGGGHIAKGLAHIITQHDFTSGSYLYAEKSGDTIYKGSKNIEASEWKVV